MARKKLSKLQLVSAAVWFTFVSGFGISHAAENEQPTARTIELNPNSDFTFVQQPTSTFTIKPLKPELRSIDNLKHTEAIGVVYLGNVLLEENTTPLNVLRDLSVQISTGLDIDLALITDSTTSKSLEPHELLLLYHPQLVITLALTKIEESNEYSLIGTYAIPVTTPHVETSSTEESSEKIE